MFSEVYSVLPSEYRMIEKIKIIIYSNLFIVMVSYIVLVIFITESLNHS